MELYNLLTELGPHQNMHARIIVGVVAGTESEARETVRLLFVTVKHMHLISMSNTTRSMQFIGPFIACDATGKQDPAAKQYLADLQNSAYKHIPQPYVTQAVDTRLQSVQAYVTKEAEIAIRDKMPDALLDLRTALEVLFSVDRLGPKTEDVASLYMYNINPCYYHGNLTVQISKDESEVPTGMLLKYLDEATDALLERLEDSPVSSSVYEGYHGETVQTCAGVKFTKAGPNIFERTIEKESQSLEDVAEQCDNDIF